jgi:hypothetical protein
MLQLTTQRSHTGILVFFPSNATPLPAASPAAPTTASTSSAAPPAPQAKTCAFGPCQLIKLPSAIEPLAVIYMDGELNVS